MRIATKSTVVRFGLAAVALMVASGMLARTLAGEKPKPAARAQQPATAQAAAVLAALSGQVFVDRPGVAQPLPGSLGMRLLAGDTVRVGDTASATLYLPGGGIVRVPAGNRLEIPQGSQKPPVGANPVARMSSPSLKMLETGLWVLNDPQGSLLLSAMRGGDEPWDGDEDAGPDLLAPRYETVTATRPIFYWTGRTERARVVVGRGKEGEIVWRSEPVRPGAIPYPDGAPPLRTAGVYWWRLEPAADGAPLSARIPFRMASKEAAEKSAAFEAELAALSGATDGPALVDLLRSAYYLEAGDWTRMLAAAGRLRDLHPDSDLLSRALSGARRQMRLDEDDLEVLLELQGQGRPLNVNGAQ